jgi:hypothetical protein
VGHRWQHTGVGTVAAAAGQGQAVIALKVNGAAACQLVLFWRQGLLGWRTLDLLQGEVTGQFRPGQSVEMRCANFPTLAALKGGMNVVTLQGESLGMGIRRVSIREVSLIHTSLVPQPLRIDAPSGVPGTTGETVTVPISVRIVDSRTVSRIVIAAKAEGDAELVGSRRRVFSEVRGHVDSALRVRITGENPSAVVLVASSPVGDTTRIVTIDKRPSANRGWIIGAAAALAIVSAFEAQRLFRRRRARSGVG